MIRSVPFSSPSALQRNKLELKQLFNDGRFDECKYMLLDLLKHAEDNATKAKLHLKLADVLHLNLDKLDEAEQHYRQCIAMDPSNAKCLFHCGKLLAKRNRHKEAADCLQASVALNDTIACVQLSDLSVRPCVCSVYIYSTAIIWE